MEFKKYALSLATVFAIAFTGMADSYAETASGATANAGAVTLSGSATSSGAVRKRSNVRTVRTVVSTGSTASGASTAPSTSDPTYVEKNPTDVVTATPSDTAPSTVRKSARGTGSVKNPAGIRTTDDTVVASAKLNDEMAAGLAAGFWAAAAVFNVIWIVITLFFGFCLYRIATKLGEPYAWLGFIPYVQTYTFVKCGGKSGWWILWITIGYVAFVIPGLVLTLIVMHGISKRYGRGAGTTALFFFFPYVMLPVLAFSEPAANDGTMPTNVANPAVESIFMPETPAPAIIPAPVSDPILAPSTTVPVQETAPTDAALETTASPATVDVLVPQAPASADANPITKEAETIVDNGPGFKLPGA